MGKKAKTSPAPVPAAPPPPAGPAAFAVGSLLRLGAILGLALVLRVIGLGWGIPGMGTQPYHPDELNGIKGIYTLLNDPHHLKATYFVSTKGTGYFYTGMIAVAAASRVGLVPREFSGITEPRVLRRVYLLIRSITVALSLGTVALVFFAGRRLFGPRAGELAALIEAVSPIAVINAHYIKTDSPEAFWVMVTLALAVASVKDRRWLAASMLTAGVAGAFKYPGASALIFPLAAAALLRPDDRRARLRVALLALPLVAIGFLAFYPGAALDYKGFWYGFSSEAGRKVSSSLPDQGWRVLTFPVRLAQVGGAALPLWAWAAMAWAIARRRRESLVLLAWLAPYLILMSSSAVVLIRYAVPMMPVMALLMAAMVEDLAARPARSRSARWAAAAAVAAILLVTCLHLRTMSRPDPRRLAAAWIQSGIPAGETVAITPSHNGDIFFTVRVDRSRHKKLELYFRSDQDVSSYLGLPFNYLAANEQAWLPSKGLHPSQALFWATVSDPSRWTLLQRFSNRFSWPGILLRGRLPEDAYYLYPEIRVYRRRG